MSSIPYSRYVFGTVPWYSVLIVTGVLVALFLACREERRAGLPKDTVIDLALWLLPCGIIGARIYYVVFSFSQFRDDLWSVFRIWEGGIAIYGGIIAGLIVLFVFCRFRHLPALVLCDLVAPGLVLAQSIGRWGNWFNIEAYGLPVSRPELCFFPFSVQVPADGFIWHYATFFYESLWDMLIFVFLIVMRRRSARNRGDVFFFYVFLYAAGRLVIEELRTDSLYVSSSVRISQLFSILLCFAVLIRYLLILHRRHAIPVFILTVVCPLSSICTVIALLYALSGSFFSGLSLSGVILFLALYALLMIFSFFSVFYCLSSAEENNADDKA